MCVRQCRPCSRARNRASKLRRGDGVSSIALLLFSFSGVPEFLVAFSRLDRENRPTRCVSAVCE